MNELIVTKGAAALGKALGHNPHKLAEALNAKIERVPRARLQDSGRPSTEVLGRADVSCPERAVIELSDDLGKDEWRILGHELAHVAGVQEESLCDAFAQAFLDDSREGPLAAQRRPFKQYRM